MSAFSPPTSDIDLFCDEVLTDPYEAYRELRDAGPVVRLTRYDAWALARYDQVSSALADHETFSSASGVGYEPELNKSTAGAPIGTDPPEHDALRAVMTKRLTPLALRTLRADVTRQAHDLARSLVERGSFDAVSDLAEVFPMTVVAKLLGTPRDARDRLLRFGEAAFDIFGPLNERAEQASLVMGEMFEYISTVMARENLHPGGMVASVYTAADEGEISHEQVIPLLASYVAASMDTTIKAIGNTLLLFTRHPEAWQQVRAKPSLVPAAFEESLRLESPVQGLFRTITKDVDVDGVTLPAGDRVLLLFGAANRDERAWDEPESFDVTRNPVEHLGFGYGVHTCVGQSLARMEAQAIFAALARRVGRFELAGQPERKLSNMIRGLASLPVTLSQA